MSTDDPPSLSHLSANGSARMVDVSDKPVTTRQAVATARVNGSPAVLDALVRGELPKGEALATARIAGISAAKRTAELIPLCHPLSLEWVDVAFERPRDGAVIVRATARTAARTGVEMEALTAAAVAALSLYDMAKAADKSIEIGPIRLESKTGGKSGDYVRDTDPSSD